MISGECNTQWCVLLSRVWTIVIALAVIVLSWWRKEEERRKKSEDRRFARFGDLPVWYFSDTFQQLTILLPMEALSNAWYRSWRPLTNLMQTFQACLLMWLPFFFGIIPTYWRTTIHHDNWAELVYLSTWLSDLPLVWSRFLPPHFVASSDYKWYWFSHLIQPDARACRKYAISATQGLKQLVLDSTPLH